MNVPLSSEQITPMATSTSHRMQQTRAFKRRTTSTQNSGCPNALRVAACPSQCCPGLLIGVNAFSKPVHIVANLSEDSDSVRVSRTSNETSPLPHGKIDITGHGHVPHYCVDADKQGTVPSPSSQTSTESALAASTTSSAVVQVYEDVHACTQLQATSDDADAGGGSGCINIVTLQSVWRLRALNDHIIDNTDSMDDLFMFTIPVEESLIGQQSSLHELVLSN